MFPVGDKSYPLCLLDTLALREMVKRPQGALRHFFEWATTDERTVVPCFSLFTLIELRRSPALFDEFIELFAPIPCVLLKGYAQLIGEEVASYPDPTAIDPCAVAFTLFGGEGNQLTNLPLLLQRPELVQKEQEWNTSRQDIVDGIVSLIGNFPPEGGTYTRAQVREFVELASFSQLVYHEEAFVTRMLGDDRTVEIDSFPTLKAMTYTVFHKFYTDRNRLPSDSDAFDVIIAAATPYVEAIITENHQAEVLRKTKRRDKFLDHLQVFTLRDFRGQPPAVTDSASGHAPRASA
jgi:hypothetical protein